MGAKHIGYGLADYFENEDKELAMVKDEICRENKIPSNEEEQREFNREQFLKDCNIIE